MQIMREFERDKKEREIRKKKYYVIRNCNKTERGATEGLNAVGKSSDA